jgi:hypothetical protein
VLQNQTQEKKPTLIQEDVLEESGNESQSNDAEKIKREKRFEKMKAEWRKQVKNVMSVSVSR